MMSELDEARARVCAVQEIEYLRRWYARATDLIGIGTQESVAQGRAIYHSIFSSDVIFETTEAGAEPRSTTGPDAWVDLVLGTLGELGPTQHLIGTQIVEIRQLVLDDTRQVLKGAAHMESYVQAWHELPESRVWLFLGTYIDEVTFTPGIGWQITNMNLRRISGETRDLTA